jgi:hypothetical protein
VAAQPGRRCRYISGRLCPEKAPTNAERGAELERALDESFQLINEIVSFVCNSMVAENAVAYVTVTTSDASTKKLIKKAVEERLTRFNQMSLHTLHSMMASPSVQRDKSMHNLLSMLKDEILAQTGNALPEEIRQLDDLVKEKDEEARLEILQVCPGEAARPSGCWNISDRSARSRSIPGASRCNACAYSASRATGQPQPRAAPSSLVPQPQKPLHTAQCVNTSCLHCVQQRWAMRCGGTSCVHCVQHRTLCAQSYLCTAHCAPRPVWAASSRDSKESPPGALAST